MVVGFCHSTRCLGSALVGWKDGIRSPGLVNHSFVALVSCVAEFMDTGVCSAGVHDRNDREQRNAVPAWEPWDAIQGDP